MKNIEAIFLDFDGVILESVDVKGWAFGKLFEDYPKHVQEIVAFHHAHGGMSRFEKFHIIYDTILKEQLTNERFKTLCDEFSRIVLDKVLECPFVPGALVFLKKYSKKCNLFIISGTPHEEMRFIVTSKGLETYFEDVLGSPIPKAEWVKKLIYRYKLDKNKVLFVGDAMSDLKAAQENDIRFVARVKENDDVFKDLKIDYRVRDLYELSALLGNGML